MNFNFAGKRVEMLVMKFGGTSLGRPERMRQVLEILQRDSMPKVVVLSAMSGTTNALVVIHKLLVSRNKEEAASHIQRLLERYNTVVEELLSEDMHIEAQEIIKSELSQLTLWSDEAYNDDMEGQTLAIGELISTKLFSLLCQSEEVDAKLLSSLEFMMINNRGAPDLNLIEEKLKSILENTPEQKIYLTQGYICKNQQGDITNLGRGGSDYTATIIGAVLDAEEIQIWTDIDGVHNNDPRIVDGTQPIRFLSYREAAELAYFGAKILHPTCVLPAEKRQVPVRLKYTMEPNAQGTLISSKSSQKKITAIAAKDGIIAIKIYSRRMLMAYGFLREVFQIFEDYKTSVDMITTSEVAVSLTIDDDTNIRQIQNDLTELGETAIDSNYTIICIVGSGLYDSDQEIYAVFKALKGIPIRMTSMGGSKNNISLLVKTDYKTKALQALNEILN